MSREFESPRDVVVHLIASLMDKAVGCGLPFERAEAIREDLATHFDRVLDDADYAVMLTSILEDWVPIAQSVLEDFGE